MMFGGAHLEALDLDPAVRAALARRAAYALATPYIVRDADLVAGDLQSFFAGFLPGEHIRDVRRLGGGASQEQFAFHLIRADGEARQYVLRMDPGISLIENDRVREFDILKAMHGIVPVPEVLWIDPDGRHFGQPAYIMKYVDGVTDAAGTVTTNLGVRESDRFGGNGVRIADQFLDHLVAIQQFDWHRGLPGYAAPDADARQAARWQLDWWTAVWQQDAVVPFPVMAAAEVWMRDNLPTARPEDLVVSHGDYRTGNYLFDPASGEITAILDWKQRISVTFTKISARRCPALRQHRKRRLSRQRAVAAHRLHSRI